MCAGAVSVVGGEGSGGLRAAEAKGRVLEMSALPPHPTWGGFRRGGGGAIAATPPPPHTRSARGGGAAARRRRKGGGDQAGAAR